ncbi:hypothetical protein [Nocardia xishanensis]|uniref:hypothetical protein n=1 Tax=Nocardia xishanensis TaxID=238964 RepID=UPI000832D73A|nr:hypothetical protein [Nocardia xishanensis]
MTETISARRTLENELGDGLTALYLLSEAQCADLLTLLNGAAGRDRALAESELADSIARLPWGIRSVVRAVLLRGRR